MTCYNLFFQLLQVTLGERQRLDIIPSGEEWGRVLALARKQAVV